MHFWLCYCLKFFSAVNFTFCCLDTFFVSKSDFFDRSSFVFCKFISNLKAYLLRIAIDYVKNLLIRQLLFY